MTSTTTTNPDITEEPTSIERRHDIEIGMAGERKLTGDLYLPARHEQARPALTIVHGGGWRKGSAKGVRGFGEYLSQAGFVCLCPDYRLSGEAFWPAQLEDVRCAIRFLKAHSETFGLDPARVGCLGDSAGGHLALMCATDAPFEGDGGFADQSNLIKAVGAMYGPVRVRKTRADGSAIGLIAPDASEEDYRNVDPINYDLAEFPPCLLIHGVEDPAVPFAGTLELHAKLVALARTVELHSFAGERHAFDRRSSTQERMVDVLDPSAHNGPIVLKLITRFFKKYL